VNGAQSKVCWRANFQAAEASLDRSSIQSSLNGTTAPLGGLADHSGELDAHQFEHVALLVAEQQCVERSHLGAVRADAVFAQLCAQLVEHLRVLSAPSASMSLASHAACSSMKWLQSARDKSVGSMPAGRLSGGRDARSERPARPRARPCVESDERHGSNALADGSGLRSSLHISKAPASRASTPPAVDSAPVAACADQPLIAIIAASAASRPTEVARLPSAAADASFDTASITTSSANDTGMPGRHAAGRAAGAGRTAIST